MVIWRVMISSVGCLLNASHTELLPLSRVSVSCRPCVHQSLHPTLCLLSLQHVHSTVLNIQPHRCFCYIAHTHTHVDGYILILVCHLSLLCLVTTRRREWKKGRREGVRGICCGCGAPFRNTEVQGMEMQQVRKGSCGWSSQMLIMFSSLTCPAIVCVYIHVFVCDKYI